MAARMASITSEATTAFTATLETSTTVDGPWTPVPGATSPYGVTNAGGLAVFYRLKNY